jgi:hypothetical protein
MTATTLPYPGPSHSPSGARLPINLRLELAASAAVVPIQVAAHLLGAVLRLAAVLVAVFMIAIVFGAGGPDVQTLGDISLESLRMVAVFGVLFACVLGMVASVLGTLLWPDRPPLTLHRAALDLAAAAAYAELAAFGRYTVPSGGGSTPVIAVPLTRTRRQKLAATLIPLALALGVLSIIDFTVWDVPGPIYPLVSVMAAVAGSRSTLTAGYCHGVEGLRSTAERTTGEIHEIHDGLVVNTSRPA